MHKNYRSWGVAAVVLYCLLAMFPPCGAIVGACMLIKPLMVTLEANDTLDSRTVYTLPSWINDCSDTNAQFPTTNQFSTDTISTEVTRLNSLAICLITTMVLSSCFICMALSSLLVWCCPCCFEDFRNEWREKR